MEALAVGVPLALSDLPVFAEAARFARGVEWLAGAMEQAALTPDAQRRRGRELAARRTWAAAATAHPHLYRRVHTAT